MENWKISFCRPHLSASHLPPPPLLHRRVTGAHTVESTVDLTCCLTLPSPALSLHAQATSSSLSLARLPSLALAPTPSRHLQTELNRSRRASVSRSLSRQDKRKNTNLDTTQSFPSAGFLSHSSCAMNRLKDCRHGRRLAPAPSRN